MALEMLAHTPTPQEIGLTPTSPDHQLSPVELAHISPPLFEFPDHLTRRAIKKATEENGGIFLPSAWVKRGQLGEIRTQKVLETATDIVKTATLNPPYEEESDITVVFVDDFPLKGTKIDVKTSTLALRMEKRKIRDEILSEEIRAQMIGPWTEEALKAEWSKKIDEWNQKADSEKELIISSRLTETNRILINAGEEDLKEKYPDEILRDSLYPQTERLIDVANGMTPREAVLAQRDRQQRQFWPWVPPAKFTEIFPELRGGE